MSWVTLAAVDWREVALWSLLMNINIGIFYFTAMYLCKNEEELRTRHWTVTFQWFMVNASSAWGFAVALGSMRDGPAPLSGSTHQQQHYGACM